MVEGEASVERLWNTIGGSMPATSSVGGLSQWDAGHVEQLKRTSVQDVGIIPDARKEGWDHAYVVARSCGAAGLGVRMVFLPDGVGNVSAYFEAGHEKRELEKLILAAPSFTGPSLAPLDDRDAAPMRWLWPGRMSLGGVTVLDSVFDAEKRLVAFDIAARVSTGRAMPDGPSGLEAPRRYGMTGSLSYSRRARARDKAAEAAYDSRVDTERGVRAADERSRS